MPCHVDSWNAWTDYTEIKLVGASNDATELYALAIVGPNPWIAGNTAGPALRPRHMAFGYLEPMGLTDGIVARSTAYE